MPASYWLVYVPEFVEFLLVLPIGRRRLCWLPIGWWWVAFSEARGRVERMRRKLAHEPLRTTVKQEAGANILRGGAFI